MSKVLIEEQTLYDIGDAIRAINGTVMTYKPSEMADAIDAVGSSIEPPTLLYKLNESDGQRWISTGLQSSTIGDYLLVDAYSNGDIIRIVLSKKENIAVFTGSRDVYTTIFILPDENYFNVRFDATDNDTLYVSFSLLRNTDCAAYIYDISSYVRMFLVPA